MEQEKCMSERKKYVYTHHNKATAKAARLCSSIISNSASLLRWPIPEIKKEAWASDVTNSTEQFEKIGIFFFMGHWKCANLFLRTWIPQLRCPRVWNISSGKEQEQLRHGQRRRVKSSPSSSYNQSIRVVAAGVERAASTWTMEEYIIV